MIAWSGLLQLLLALTLAPLLMAVVYRTKALFAGRRGQPWLQPYRDLAKLLRKSAVYSRTTTFVFRAGPIVACAGAALTLSMLPLGGRPALVSFSGDFLLVAYLLGLGRFLTIVAALDTGSSFEGMGASREAFFSALAEPALLVAMTALAAFSGQLSLSGIYAALGTEALASPAGPALMLVALALGIVFLTENSRIPVDDPTTHLELTMIHEVMVLDHGGVDLAMIQYGAALKLWILGSLAGGVLFPTHSGYLAADLLVGLGGIVLVAVATGVVESIMARLRLARVPQFVIAASVLSIVALVLVMR